MGSIPGIDWSLRPMHMPANVRAVVDHFENSQWWPPTVMCVYQQQLLSQVVDHARSTVPFYKQRLDEAGVPEGNYFDAYDWHRIPILSRTDVQRAGFDLHSTGIPESHLPSVLSMTGGATAQPVGVLNTSLTSLYWSACTVRDHLWQGRDFSGTLASIRYCKRGEAPPPQGTQLADWGQSTRGLFRTGRAVVLSVSSNVDEQVNWLLTENPVYLMTYPSVALAIAHGLRDRNARLSNLRELRTFGETLEANVRNECREILGSRVVDVYSSEEVGYIALECPQGGCYHIQSEHLLVEVLAADGKPCLPGEIGRVVLTTLTNYAMPLLRYGLGDYAEVGEECACGRKLPTLRRILGRTRNMIRLPDGTHRWPAISLDPAEAAQANLPVLQFQVVQDSLEHLTVNLVATRELTNAEAGWLRSQAEVWFGYPFEIEFRYVDSIPRSPTGKFEDFICRV